MVTSGGGSNSGGVKGVVVMWVIRVAIAALVREIVRKLVR